MRLKKMKTENLNQYALENNCKLAKAQAEFFRIFHTNAIATHEASLKLFKEQVEIFNDFMTEYVKAVCEPPDCSSVGRGDKTGCAK
jgi:hypothetical protein